jgi:hypothetical protein
MKALVTAAIFGCVCAVGQAHTVSPLFARGYTVIPEPQNVVLEAKDFSFDQSWHLKLDQGVAKDDVAVEVLRHDLASRFNVRLGVSANSAGTLSLRIEPRSVPIGTALDSDKHSLQEQAYRIDLHIGAVSITANASTGLFYGVETLIQLLRRDMGTSGMLSERWSRFHRHASGTASCWWIRRDSAPWQDAEERKLWPICLHATLRCS